MMPLCALNVEFFEQLSAIDERLATATAAEPCAHCGGPLHRANYRRKPRGGLLAVAGEQATLRHSLCCGAAGCRRRTLPPSVIFLGRRVYLEVIVVIASAWALIAASVAAASEVSGVPMRSLQRWGDWWVNTFSQSRTWGELRPRFAAPPMRDSDLPLCLLERIRKVQGRDPPLTKTLIAMAQHLASATTNDTKFSRIVGDVLMAV